MKIRFIRALLATLLLVSLWPSSSRGQDFKKWEAEIAEYKRWLDHVGSNGSRFWIKLDSKSRPHRLYVGEGFHNASHKEKEEFVEIFSHYLAGHPEKLMLIDLFDGATEKPIGELGWGGFKLYPNYRWPTKEPSQSE